jgi:Ner family transcriptional regulator
LPLPTVGWHRQDIIAELKKKGSSLAAVGREIGLSRATMAWALIRRHPRANLAIAEFLGVPTHELWPHWFLPTEPSSGAQPTPAKPSMSPTANRAA